MEYLIRLVQVHEKFRKAEIEALASLHNIELEFVTYEDGSPFCIVRLRTLDGTPLGSGDDDEDRYAGELQACRSFFPRSVLAKAICEVWGRGKDYDELHRDVRQRSAHLWPRYQKRSFRFDLDAYQGKRGPDQLRPIIESFIYIGFTGRIVMARPEERFWIFEEWETSSEGRDCRADQAPSGARIRLKQVYFCRWIANSGRDVIKKYDLKLRKYLSTTSMDSELALVTANLALSAPGKVFYDPFVGTGSFPIACAHFGALTLGSDIDGRTIRGSKAGVNITSNFKQYGLDGHWTGGFIADLTNTPVRAARWLDGIVCDPPYGVREGLKVLGHRDPERGREAVIIDGELAHRAPGYIAPKKPYSFTALLRDLLDFSATTLVDEGRLCLWMPTASETGEEDADSPEFNIPSHPSLHLMFVCLQRFNKWSRRLLVYRRIPDGDLDRTDGLPCPEASSTPEAQPSSTNVVVGVTANDLNPFRKKFFQGFR